MSNRDRKRDKSNSVPIVKREAPARTPFYVVVLPSDGSGGRELMMENPKSYFPGGACTQISLGSGMDLFYLKQTGAVLNQAASTLVHRLVSGDALVVSKNPLTREELFVRVEQKNVQALTAAREMASAMKDGSTMKGKGIVRGKAPAELQGKKIDLDAIEQVLGNGTS